jgi:subtilisin-like proprotein convertase family protein
MKNTTLSMIRACLYFLLVSILLSNSYSQGVNTYTFAQNAGTYSAITGTQIITSGTDDGSSGATNIGFPFRMGGASFTQFVANANGHIRLGNAGPTAFFLPISTTSNTYSISAFGRDGRAQGGVFVQTVGSAPDRVCIVQYTNYRVQYDNTNNSVDFQIRLYESSNVIQIVYGASARANTYTGEIGIRGTNGAADFSNRTTTTDWSSTTAGGASNATVTWSTTVFPASGQTYTWTPPTANYRYYAYNLNYGSSTWCQGETRTISVDIKNTGTNTWTDAAPDINVGVKWNTNGGNWADYHVRTDAGSVAPGASATYFLTITARNATAGPTYSTDLAAGNNNLTIDMVNEANCWFGNNPGTCGAGTATMNMPLVSPNITISPLPAQPSTITGPTSFCGGTIQSYSVTNVAGVTYNWSFPAGWTQLTGGTTNSITVQTSNTSGNVTVTPSNACGNGPARTLAVTVNPVNGDPAVYGTGSWIGYVYQHTNANNPSPQFTAPQYRGFYGEPEIFDRDWGSGSISGASICNTYADRFHIRYRMTKDMPCGLYTFTVGADDGVRLSVDGGATWIINGWINQGYTTYQSAQIALNGSTNFVLEYYEDGGGARVSFNYSYVNVTPTGVNAGSNFAMCSGESVPLSASVNPNCITSTSSNITAQNIPDNNLTTGVTSIINIPNSCVTAANITSVYVNITHTWNADLDIYLIAPDGTQIALALDKGGSGDNYNCTFITGGATLPTTNTTINGNFAPETPFSSLGSGAASGNWTLRVFDDAGGDIGTLNSWAITLSQSIPITYSWSPSTGLSSSTILNPSASPASTTTYTLTASSFGCGATSNVTVTVNTPAGDPTIFGNNQWNVYAYNGNDVNLAANSYRGYYIQPALSPTNYGVNTLSFWDNMDTPSQAGAPLGSGNLWNGCDVTPDVHTVIHKRRGFPCGLYEFTMNSWDDPAEVIINGVTVWSCATWSGSGACTIGSIGQYALDANSEVEVRHREFAGGSNLNLTITQIQPTVLGINGSTRTCPVTGGSDFVHFVDNNGRLIAAVNPQGNNLGNVTMTSYVQTAPFQIDACLDPQPQFNTATLGRRWVITPTTQPTGNVTVRLYYHADEYNALEPIANSNANVNDNTVGFFDLHLSKYHNSTNPALVNSSATDNCPSGVTTIHGPGASGTAASIITGFDANGLYNEYTISSFSEFWLHGSNNMSPLPVTLTAFNASCEDNGVRVNWSTASEQNASHFDVQRSRDGFDWETIGTQLAAGTTNTPQNYELTDATFPGGTIYYRLRQVDQDGTVELYGPISATCEAAGYSLSVYPNPATNSFTVQVYAESTVSGGQLGVYDFTGKAILQQSVELQNGVHTFHFNDAGLARGTYLIRLSDSEGRFTPVRLVIQ